MSESFRQVAELMYIQVNELGAEECRIRLCKYFHAIIQAHCGGRTQEVVIRCHRELEVLDRQSL